jgi:tetratricopeptide (TPR) repeat protein
MNPIKKTLGIKIALVLCLAIIVCLGLTLRAKHFFEPTETHGFPQKRPSTHFPHIYDEAQILKDLSESINRHLQMIQEQYAIEIMLVSIPAIPQTHTIESLAAELFSGWEIGKSSGGRGLLLVLADNAKQIKIEVSYELEDVFTDIFCGYIEDKQLQAYFLSNQMNIGMVAVLEEIEHRAHLKRQADYSPADIAQLDRELFSGGAGAKRQLAEYQPEHFVAVGDNYPAGSQPDQAWQTYIRSWENRVRDPNLGVYTEITRLAYRDFQNLPDSRYEEDFRKYKNKPYEVIQNENYAVIFFGNQKGWENAPFLFCKTTAGWQFDIVHQRKYIRMGRNPTWGIERSNHPYVDLLNKCPHWMNQDIPLKGDDVYQVADDHQLAQAIRHLEKVHATNPEEFQTILQLAKLYTVASLRPQQKISMLQKAKQLNPESPEPYKYLGIAYLDAFYQFESAITEMEAYTRRRPEDVFGHNYLGYLYYCVQNYKPAVDEFETAVQLQPDNCYAYAKLARVYAALYLASSKIDPRRAGYRRQALEMFSKAAATASPDPKRIQWLEQYLIEKGILD